MDKKSVQEFLSEWGASGWVFTILFVLSLFMISSGFVRDLGKDLFAPADRKILSIVDNKFQAGSNFRQAAKILTPKGILVEIYGAADPQGRRPLTDSVLIPDRQDAYYDLNDRATNFAVTDLNSDGQPEIIAPTFDSSGRPRLNVIGLNKDTGRYEILE
jgi:hypothetical protein